MSWAELCIGPALAVFPVFLDLAVVGNDRRTSLPMQLAVLVELHVGIVALDSRKVPSVEEAILEAQDGSGVCIQSVVDKRVALLVGEMLACKVRETRGRIGLVGEAHLFSFPGMAGLPSGI